LVAEDGLVRNNNNFLKIYPYGIKTSIEENQKEITEIQAFLLTSPSDVYNLFYPSFTDLY